MRPRRARLDASLRATIIRRVPLAYVGGSNAALDRPAHVRAGSSLTWWGDRLALVQDDANFIALIDPETGLAESITLPAGDSGLRQFDDARGNKDFKMDLEACCAIEGTRGPRLLALGSGSRQRRRRILVVDGACGTAPSTSLIHAEALYRALEDAVDFSGSDMNIEGALALPGVVRLFGRGNGAPGRGRVPLNATCDLALDALLAYLDAPDARPAPEPVAIMQYVLGVLDGIALGFTDAAHFGEAVLYAASAEGSTTAREDGPVAGSVLGVLPSAGELRYAPIVDERGAIARDKVEGVAPAGVEGERVYVVVDADDPARPSELCHVRLRGPWHAGGSSG